MYFLKETHTNELKQWVEIKYLNLCHQGVLSNGLVPHLQGLALFSLVFFYAPGALTAATPS